VLLSFEMFSFRHAIGLLLFSSMFELVVGYDSGFSILLSHSKPEINVRFGEEGQERDIGNSDVAKHQAYSPTVGSYPARLYYPSNRQYRTRITFYT